MQVQTLILNQMLFRCHAATDFTAQFERASQTSQANKFCRKHNPIILLIFGTLPHGDHSLQWSVCSVPLQGDLRTITQYCYFPVLTSVREIVYTSYRSHLVWWSYDLLLLPTNVLLTGFLIMFALNTNQPFSSCCLFPNRPFLMAFLIIFTLQNLYYPP